MTVGLILAAGGVYAQDITIPAGGLVGLFGGTQDLGCADLIVDGTYDLGGGTLTGVRNVRVSSGGALILGNGGALSLAGDWSNAGTFSADSGNVNIVDDAACAAGSSISGNSAFHDLTISSNSGKLVQFVAGSSQSVGHALTLTGVPGTPLRIESTTPGTPSADINLAAAGTQALADLAVRGMTASGQWLAANQTNDAAGGVVDRWFGSGEPQPGPSRIAPIPTLSHWGLAVLALAAAALGLRRRRRWR